MSDIDPLRKSTERLDWVAADRFSLSRKSGDPVDDGGTSTTAHSICVLPFENMSGEPEQEYFSDGITEDIITDLSNVSALSVVARNTSFTLQGPVDRCKGGRAEAWRHSRARRQRPQSGKPRADHRPADRWRNGDHVWAERYDRDLTDIFAIQDEISKAIVDALKVRLLPEGEEGDRNRGTSNVDAYNVYLMARQQWVSGNFGDPRRDEAIVRLCHQATLLDQDYAQAWALMALAQAELRFVHGREEMRCPLQSAPSSLIPHFRRRTVSRRATSKKRARRRKPSGRCAWR